MYSIESWSTNPSFTPCHFVSPRWWSYAPLQRWPFPVAPVWWAVLFYAPSILSTKDLTSNSRYHHPRRHFSLPRITLFTARSVSFNIASVSFDSELVSPFQLFSSPWHESSLSHSLVYMCPISLELCWSEITRWSWIHRRPFCTADTYLIPGCVSKCWENSGLVSSCISEAKCLCDDVRFRTVSLMHAE